MNTRRRAAALTLSVLAAHAACGDATTRSGAGRGRVPAAIEVDAGLDGSPERPDAGDAGATPKAACPFPIRPVVSARFLTKPNVLVTSAGILPDGVTGGMDVFDGATGEHRLELPIQVYEATFYPIPQYDRLVVVPFGQGAHPIFLSTSTFTILGKGEACGFGLIGKVGRDGKRFFAACDDPEHVYAYDAVRGKQIGYSDPGGGGASGIWSGLVESADGAILYHWTHNGRTLQARHSTSLAFLTPSRESPRRESAHRWGSAIPSPDGRRVIGTDTRGRVGFINARLTGMESFVTPALVLDTTSGDSIFGWSDDSRYAIAVRVYREDGTVFVFDARTGRQVARRTLTDAAIAGGAEGLYGDRRGRLRLGSSVFELPTLKLLGPYPVTKSGPVDEYEYELPNGTTLKIADKQVSVEGKGPHGVFQPLATLPSVPLAPNTRGPHQSLTAPADTRVVVFPAESGAIQVVRVSDGSVLEWLEYYDAGTRKRVLRRSDGAFEGDARALDCLPKVGITPAPRAGLLKEHLAAPRKP